MWKTLHAMARNIAWNVVGWWWGGGVVGWGIGTVVGAHWVAHWYGGWCALARWLRDGWSIVVKYEWRL